MDKYGQRNRRGRQYPPTDPLRYPPTPSYSYGPTDDDGDGSPDGTSFTFGPGFTNSSPSDDDSTPMPSYLRGSSSHPMSEDAVYSGSNDEDVKVVPKHRTVPDSGRSAQQNRDTPSAGAAFRQQGRNRPSRHFNTPVRNGNGQHVQAAQLDIEDDGFDDGLDFRSPPKGVYQGRYGTAATTPSAPSRIRFPSSSSNSSASRAQDGGSRFARPPFRPSHNAPISQRQASNHNDPNRSSGRAYQRPPGLTSPPPSFLANKGQYGARESVRDDQSSRPPCPNKDDEVAALRRTLRMAENEIDRLREIGRHDKRKIRRLQYDIKSAESFAKAAALHQRVKDSQTAAAIAEQMRLRQELVQLAGVRRLNKAQKLIFGDSTPGVFDIPGEIENLKFAKETLGGLFLRSVEKVDTVTRMLQSVTGCLVAMRDPKSETVITVIAKTVDAVERGLSPMRKAARDMKALPGGGLPHATPPSDMLRTIADEIFDANRVAVQLGCVNAFNNNTAALLSLAERARKKGNAKERGRWLE